jgi:hypothetical protein
LKIKGHSGLPGRWQSKEAMPGKEYFMKILKFIAVSAFACLIGAGPAWAQGHHGHYGSHHSQSHHHAGGTTVTTGNPHGVYHGQYGFSGRNDDDGSDWRRYRNGAAEAAYDNRYFNAARERQNEEARASNPLYSGPSAAGHTDVMTYGVQAAPAPSPHGAARSSGRSIPGRSRASIRICRGVEAVSPS